MDNHKEKHRLFDEDPEYRTEPGQVDWSGPSSDEAYSALKAYFAQPSPKLQKARKSLRNKGEKEKERSKTIRGAVEKLKLALEERRLKKNNLP